MKETTRQIIDRIASFKETTLTAIDADAATPSLEEFALLLSGISSCRKIPGIDIHMGYESLYICNEENGKLVRAHLQKLYNITDRDSLVDMCNHLYSTDNDLVDFRSFWSNNPSFDINELNGDGKKYFCSCMEYAENFDKLAGEGGFYAWDCNEVVGLLRAGYAANLITKDEFWSFVKPMARNAAHLFHSWKEFATSCLCGSVYFMFREQGCNEDVMDFFDINYKLVESLLHEGGAWQRNTWYEMAPKEFFIKNEDMKILLDQWQGAEGCFATDRILVDGEKVGYMYREEPEENNDWDSGWRFTAGDEDQEYMDNPDHSGIYALNTICNYDSEIIELLDAPYGTAFIRNNGQFVEDK